MILPKDISEYDEAAEHKIVVGDKTFTEKAIKEMAEQGAACLCCVQFGRCSEDDCGSCAAFHRYNRCLNSLSDYDKIRLRNETMDNYLEYSRSPGSWLSHKNYIKYYLLIILMVLVSCGVLFCFIASCMPTAKPQQYERITKYSQIPDEVNNQIINVLKYIYNNPPEDLNEDKRINCIDYSFYFKQIWDARSVELNLRCECLIAWNQAYLYRGKSAMNHLFIVLRLNDTMQQIELEPWVWESWQTNLFLMNDRWNANEYFSEYNNYEYYTKMYARRF